MDSFRFTISISKCQWASGSKMDDITQRTFTFLKRLRRGCLKKQSIFLLSQEPLSQINHLQIIFILPCLDVDPSSSIPFMLKFRSTVCSQGNYKSLISSHSDASLNCSFIFFGEMEQNSSVYIFFSFFVRQNFEIFLLY